LTNAIVNWWKSHGREQRKHRREYERDA
jgi:hypothetical protein